jgi:hypothetical protein
VVLQEGGDTAPGRTAEMESRYAGNYLGRYLGNSGTSIKFSNTQTSNSSPFLLKPQQVAIIIRPPPPIIRALLASVRQNIPPIINYSFNYSRLLLVIACLFNKWTKVVKVFIRSTIIIRTSSYLRSHQTLINNYRLL